MGQAHSGIRRIDTLAAVAGRAHHVDADIFLVDHDIHFLCLRHDRHGHSGCVDPSAALRLRHTLYTVHTALVFQPGVRSLSRDHEHALLETADAVFIQGDQLCLPVTAVRIVYIHAVDLSRKKGRLIAAGACPDLNDNILVIIRVFGKEKDLQLLLQFLHALPGLIQLFLCQLAHFLVRFFLQHSKAVIDILLTFFILIVRFHDGRKVALLLHQSAESLLVIRRPRLCQLSHHFFIANQ